MTLLRRKNFYVGPASTAPPHGYPGLGAIARRRRASARLWRRPMHHHKGCGLLDDIDQPAAARIEHGEIIREIFEVMALKEQRVEVPAGNVAPSPRRFRG